MCNTFSIVHFPPIATAIGNKNPRTASSGGHHCGYAERACILVILSRSTVPSFVCGTPLTRRRQRCTKTRGQQSRMLSVYALLCGATLVRSECTRATAIDAIRMPDADSKLARLRDRDPGRFGDPARGLRKHCSLVVATHCSADRDSASILTPVARAAVPGQGTDHRTLSRSA
jgi:hypothetical protein